RSPSKLLKVIAQSRSLTQASASLRTSPGGVAQQMQCDVEGAPYYSVMISRNVGCALAGQNLGPKTAKVDLIFYGGRHLACDKLPQSPCMTLTQEVALLIDRFCGAELPAVLFHGGDSVEGSAITLKGTEGGKLATIPNTLPDY
ncbi:MAG: hypothetical protein Q9175_008319, partial [Cornicularia normoerica]